MTVQQECPYVTKYALIVVHKWNWHIVRKQMSIGQDIIPTNIDIKLDNDAINNKNFLKDKLNLDSFG